jgi:hypothetical protein
MKFNHSIFFLIIFILGFSINGKTQSEWGGNGDLNANIGLAIGYSGVNPNVFQIGLGFQPYVGYPLFGFTALYEFSPESELQGASFNMLYLSGPIALGIGANKYMYTGNATFGIKPMIGVSILRIGIFYGFNIFLNKNEISDLGHSSVNVNYYLPLLKRKDQKFDNELPY